MELITNVKGIRKNEEVIRRKRKGNYDNTIYTFDIEVSSLFKIDGIWKGFDFNKEDYTGIEKCSVPYICMFGINEDVYYFRDFMMFGDILEYISSDVKKYLFIHNLSYEMCFLQNIFEEKNWTVTKMTSRDIRKPIAFYVPEINIEFRCTYMLTNMSLENASKIYTNVRKKSGQLDYNKVYSPLSYLDSESLEYCEFDIICLFNIVKFFKSKYDGKLANVPFTSTGEVRKEIKKVIDYWYMVKRWKNVPERKMYLIYMLSFSGGYTHANMLHSGKVLHNISSRDIASSYPSCFFEKFPREDFRFCPVEEYLSQPDDYAYIVQVEFSDIECMYYNTYIQKSKIVNSHVKDVIFDNGRLVKASGGTFEMFLTEIDFEIIKKTHKGNYKIIECWKAYKNYLDKRILKFILEMYRRKTVLKKDDQTEEEKTMYRNAKANINSLYGCSVSNILKQSSDFKNGQWQRYSFSDEFVDSKIEEARHSWSTLFDYTTGLYVTSYARRNLFLTLIQLDKDVIYCDTDSIKYRNNHDDVFERFNESVIERYNKCIEYYPDDFTIDDFQPTDQEGIKHLLGVFEIENDGDIKVFKTLGAKKYCYELDDGLHLTLSGVNKKGVKALNGDINNFRNGFVFGYDEAQKLIHFYDDEQPIIDFIDCQGNEYHSELQHGVILQPTTYKIGQTLEYELLLNAIQIEESEVEYNG